MLEGTVKLINGTAWRSGSATIYLDNVLYTNVSVKDDGTFLSNIQLPMGLSFGSHSIKAQYTPNEPWIQCSEVTVQILAYNTHIILFAVGAILAVSSLAVYMRVRSKRAAITPPFTLTTPAFLEKSLLHQQYSSKDLISAIGAERDLASKVLSAYHLAQTLICLGLGEAPRESETHLEYLSRVTKRAPDLKSTLRCLVELFELAEYSPYPIDSGQSEEATEILLKLRQEMTVVK
jgi:hypothetical protein